MTLRCSRSTEVLDLLARGHWPLACPAELRTHLEVCRSCSELLAISRAFQRARSAASAKAQLPSPGVLWWRAQLRRRNAAVKSVGRPILGAYAFALGMLLMVAVGFLVQQARHGFSWFDWISPAQIASSVPSLSLSSGSSLFVILPIFATIVLVSAVVVYITTERQ